MTRLVLRPTSLLLPALLLTTFFLTASVRAQPGTVLSEYKIADGGFTDGLDDTDLFGEAVAPLGDLDGDGTPDFAVGAPLDDDGGGGPSADRGAVWVLFMNPNGSVRAHQKLSATAGSFTGTLDVDDEFGWALASAGDLDGDGRAELAVGAPGDDDGGVNRGAVYVLFLNADGTVASHRKISDTRGGFAGALDDTDGFGYAVTSAGDLDGDGTPDLAVGASGDDDGGSARGAVWVLFLRADGTVRFHQKISDTEGTFTGTLDNNDLFGYAVTSVGDLDGNGRAELAVGARGDDDGGTNRGAAWVLFLNASGTVASHRKISDTAGGFTGVLDNGDEFGYAVGAAGDLDGDGRMELVVGAPWDDDGGFNRGAAWVLFLNASGTVRFHQKISDTEGGFPGALDDSDLFGRAVVGVGDLDGDGRAELAVGASFDDDGGLNRGGVWALFLHPNGAVREHQKLSATEGRTALALSDGDAFGRSVVSLGDLDGDGRAELAVGAWGDDDGGTSRGAVWVLFLNADGSVRDEQKISDTEGGFTGALDDNDLFGSSVAALGDLDGDGIPDLAVGAEADDDGGPGSHRGAVWVLFLNDNGTVRSHQKISDTEGGFNGQLDNSNFFGGSVATVGDLDGDGIPDLAVGADGDDDGGTNRGAVWVLFLNADGTVASHQKISDTEGGFSGILDGDDYFGGSVAALGDLDGDGIPDLAVGAPLDDDGGFNRGAVWVLFLDGEPANLPNYDLTATNTSPLTVAPGGQVSFAYTITNNTAGAVSGDLFYTVAPGGLAGTVVSGTVPAGQTVTGSYTQQVPGNAPAGSYTYTLRIGQFPNVTVDAEAFTVTVQGTAARSAAAGRDGSAAWGVASASPWEPVGPTAGSVKAERFALHPAYPNPLSRSATLAFALPEATDVRLVVYDLLGREVAILVDATVEAGEHSAPFDASALPSGTYLVRLEAGGAVETQRLTLVR